MINKNEFKSISKIQNSEVKQLASEAADFLLSHRWCDDIKEGYLSFAIAGVLGVFLFEIIPSEPEVDETLWVITGDLPPAYLVTDDAENWQEALVCYVYEMRLWVETVKNSESLDGVIPVDVAPTKEYAEMLESRLQFIEDNMINVPYDSIEKDS